MTSDRYMRLLYEMWETHKKKNAGYSGSNPDPWSNFRRSETLGVSAWLGVTIRLTDKYSRMVSLINSPSNNQCNESLRDTLIDLASYALIIVCLLDELNEKQTAT